MKMQMQIRWTLAGLLSVACGFSWAAEPSPATPAPPAGLEVEVTRVSPAALAARIDDGDPDLVVLDVRSKEEFAAGHVPGARNVSHDQLQARLNELAPFKDKEVVLYCRSGRRAQLAAQILRDAGFTRLVQLEGDYPAWEAGGWEARRNRDSAPAASPTD